MARGMAMFRAHAYGGDAQHGAAGMLVSCAQNNGGVKTKAKISE